MRAYPVGERHAADEPGKTIYHKGNLVGSGQSTFAILGQGVPLLGHCVSEARMTKSMGGHYVGQWGLMDSTPSMWVSSGTVMVMGWRRENVGVDGDD